MKLHSRARTSPFQRRRIATKVTSGDWTIKGAARTHGVSARTVRKWVHRAKLGEPMTDRSSRRATSALMISEELKAFILSMRRFRLPAQQISDIVHVPRSG